MKQPHTVTKSFLEESLKHGWIGTGISTTNVPPCPRLRKYYYWIYHYEMPYQSAEDIFWKEEHKLSLKKAMELKEYLHKNKIPYAVANRSYFRLGTKIWDYKTLKRKYPNIKFAISFDEDTDEEYQGHK